VKTAELVKNRSNADKANMGLTSWRGLIVRKQDVAIVKNYLKAVVRRNINSMKSPGKEKV